MPVKRQRGGNASSIAMVATFIRGLNLFQPFLVLMLGSSFAMRRFGYGNEVVSTFVTFCSNAMDLIYTCSILCTAVMITVLKYSAQTYFNYVTSGISIFSVCFTVVVNTLLLRLYALADDVNNITRYYWLLLLASFAAGMDVTCITTIAADSISPFASGISLSGIIVACFHWFVIRLLKNCRLDVDYWLILSQLVLISTLSLVGAVVWIGYLIRDKIVGTSENTDSGDAGKGAIGSSLLGYMKTFPMVIASAVALGAVWAIYPYISPFELVPFRYQYPIMLGCVVFEALSGIGLMLIDNVGKCIQKDWYKYPYAWWHLIWFLFIPYFGIAILFLRCMHYPHSTMVQAVLGRPFVIGFLTVVYYTISCIIYGLCHTVIKANANGHGEVISPLNLAISLVSMDVLRYMSAAHIQQFKKAKEGVKTGKAWPTDGMSKHSAIRYWIRTAARVGYANFKEMASADVKQRLDSVASHVVSYRRCSTLE